MPDAVEIARPTKAAAIREAAALFHDRRYLQVLGKATGAGLAAGLLARKVPAIGLPVALVAGIYVGLELAAYLAEADERSAIDVPSRPVIDIPEDTDADRIP